MLAEITAANTAFSTIKTALPHGKELYDVSESCATYFNCKSTLTRRSNKNKKGSYLQNFMALEKLKKAEVMELAAEDLKIARSCLDEIVGFKSSDDLLGDIFSAFCIGK